jgi:hypothetical protein
MTTPFPPPSAHVKGDARQFYSTIAPKLVRLGLGAEVARCRIHLESFAQVYDSYRRLHAEWREAIEKYGRDRCLSVEREVEEWRRLCRDFAGDWMLPRVHITAMTEDAFDADLRRWFEQKGVNDQHDSSGTSRRSRHVPFSQQR